MRLNYFSLIILLGFLSLGINNQSIASENYAYNDNEAVDIRGPGGVKRPEPKKTLTVLSDRKVSKPKKVEKKEPEITVTCVREEYPADIKVDAPVIKHVDLNAVSRTLTVLEGETFHQLINRCRPDDFSEVTIDQLTAAIYRENPRAFDSFGPKANFEIRVPIVERIALEKSEVGAIVERKIRDGSIVSYKIPDLVLPWEEEDQKIAHQKLRKQKRDTIVAHIDQQYELCLQKNQKVASGNTSDTLTLGVNAKGQNILPNTKYIPESEVNSLVEEERKKSEEQLAKLEDEKNNVLQELNDLKNENALLKKQNIRYKLEIQKDMTNVKEQLAEILVKIEPLKEEPSPNEKTEIQEKSDSLIELLSVIGGVFFLLIIIGFAFLRHRKNHFRAMMNEDIDDNELTDEIDVFGNIAKPSKPVDSVSLNIKSTNNAIGPDLDMPDESIPEVVVDSGVFNELSPDLVPPRASEGFSEELDESTFKIDLANIANGETLSAESMTNKSPEAKSSDDDVMSAWADALNESKEEPAKPAEDTKSSDDDVMSAWADALNESKEESSKEAEKPAEDSKSSDDDVMSAWADALNESKEESSKEAEKPTEDSKSSDDDVMSAWADALNESKEEPAKPADEKPSEVTKSSDDDVMSAWADALNESKEEPAKPADEKPSEVTKSSDDDVMSAWADALNESKEEPAKQADEKPSEDTKSSDDDVMSAWADALNESKNSESTDSSQTSDEPREIKIEDLKKVEGNLADSSSQKNADNDVLSFWADALTETKDK